MEKKKFGLEFYLKNNSMAGVLIPMAGLMVITQIFNHNFLTGNNIASILKSIPFLALATLGASFPLLVGEIDISIGRIAGLCGMIFALFYIVRGQSLTASVFIAVLTGMAVGAMNAFLVVGIKMSSFIATMGTLYICGGLRYLVNGGTVITLPAEMREFSQATPLGVSWFFWIVILIYMFMAFVQKKTVFGRRLYAVGNNAGVAELQGVNVKRIKTVAYLISGAFGALAGIMATIDINSAQPSTGSNWEFKAVAACVVGGASLTGGVGNAIGVALGIFVVFVINNIINMIGISNYWADVFTGCILGGAVMLDIIRQKQKIHE
ncbi:ABC transporter permease [Candidatus Merdisoma sp. JLR.KK006]|uniref:ABC transporter permease n=1 Tax=Candidatus Merdisoma sp. JLR.KK006 TaxID=3112626 RepID=UPI002FF3ACC1